MGFIFEDNEIGIHAEARSMSFVLLTDFGEDSIELEWDRLDEVERLVKELRGYATRHNIATTYTRDHGAEI